MVFEGSINSAVVVGCIDHFAKPLVRPTSLVIDNASIHTSDEFMGNIERWSEQGLTIVPIARYSLELNLIEILWRKIKYEWRAIYIHLPVIWIPANPRFALPAGMTYRSV